MSAWGAARGSGVADHLTMAWLLQERASKNFAVACHPDWSPREAAATKQDHETVHSQQLHLQRGSCGGSVQGAVESAPPAIFARFLLDFSNWSVYNLALPS